MKTRLRILIYLSDAVSTGKITVADLCAALGINTRDRETASGLMDRIVDAYISQPWRYTCA
jgi:hypothetical protein